MKHLLTLVVSALLAFAGSPALADLVTVALVDDNGNPSQVTAAAGSSFQVKVRVDTDVSLVSGQLRLQEVTASPSGYFTLTSRIVAGTPWDPSEALSFSSPDPLVGPSYKSQDMGTLAEDVIDGTGEGVFDFLTLDVAVSPFAMAGTYKLNLTDVVFGDTEYEPLPFDLGADYEVVVPAPGAVVLGLIGLGMVSGLRKRMARVRTAA